MTVSFSTVYTYRCILALLVLCSFWVIVIERIEIIRAHLCISDRFLVLQDTVLWRLGICFFHVHIQTITFFVTHIMWCIDQALGFRIYIFQFELHLSVCTVFDSHHVLFQILKPCLYRIAFYCDNCLAGRIISSYSDKNSVRIWCLDVVRGKCGT